MKRLPLLCCCGVFLCMVAATTQAQVRLAIPAYQDPGSPEWNAWQAPGDKAVGLMIVNQNNGDDTNRYPELAASINRARAAGIFVVGYVYTGYGLRDPAVVRNRVDAVLTNYLLDGIFFDEAPTDCQAVNPHGDTYYAYYQRLGEYVRTRHVGGRLVVMNPGTQPANDCWMSIANILVTAESSSLADYRTNYQDQAWFLRYAPERFWHIIYGASEQGALPAIFALSHERGAGWLYVTDLGASNPYAAPPTFWPAEASTVADQELQSPFATARPASTDESGTAVPPKVSFRWSSANAHHWQIIVSDSASGDEADSVHRHVRRERIDVDGDGSIRVFLLGPEKEDSHWNEVQRHAVAFTLEDHVHLVELDANGLGDRVSYQIRAFDEREHAVGVSQPIPLSLSNTQLSVDISNH